MNYQWNYSYKEIKINSFEQIHEIINDYKKAYKLSDLNGDDSCLGVFFRGQNNCEWEITPSVKRSDNKISGIIIEDETKSLFEIIAYIQHYYRGTRFIDFTLNPDVAIYFACSGNEDKNGAFYIYPYSFHKAEWYTSIVLCELIRIKTSEPMSVEDLSYKIWQDYPELAESFETLEDLNGAIMSFLDHGFMALPDDISYANNIRLKRQQGCFYICGVEFVREISSRDRWNSNAGRNIFKPQSAAVPDDLKKGDMLVKLIIPKECKYDILQKLAINGITKDYLMP